MKENNSESTATEYIIDGVSYSVISHESNTSTETLHRKIEKLILRDLLNGEKLTALD